MQLTRFKGLHTQVIENAIIVFLNGKLAHHVV